MARGSRDRGVANAALEPHGIPMVFYDSETMSRMPFLDNAFDVVMNRQEAYAASEVHRVLAPGGRLLTRRRFRITARC